MENISKTLAKVNEKIINYYNNLRDIDVLPEFKDPNEIRKYLQTNYPFKEDIKLDKIIDDVSEILEKGTIHSTHQRYFGLFNPSVDYSSIVADTLVAAYNPQLAVWSQAPVAQEIELYVLQLIMKQFGYKISSSFANFTSGGAEANHSAVLCALTDKINAYDMNGLANNIKPVIYVSEESHDSFSKIAQFTGIGRKNVRKIETNEFLQMDISHLKNQIPLDISNGFTPVLVAATAGTTSAGIIDPLEEIAQICKSYNTWFHVDAAWGGAAAFSTKLKKTIKGIELADSITCDAHKWFSVSMGAGMYFCKHRDIVKKTFRIETNYMPSSTEDTFDPYATTMQWSRRLIGLKLFIMFANLGLDGFSKRIEYQAEICNILRQKLIKNNYSIINDTKLPLVCFTHEKLQNEFDFDKVIHEIYERKKVWISKVILANNKIGLRACITSFRTNEEDLDVLIEEVNIAIENL